MSVLNTITKKSEIQNLISKMRRPTQPILIVEDREENQMLLAGICQSLSVPFKISENGQIALEAVSQTKFSVFLVDLMMPVMDGKTFVSALKQINSDAVILIQTAIDETDEIIEIMKLGVYDYFVKPLNVDLIKISILKALEYRYLIDIEKALMKEESKELRDHLEWLNYKESSRKNSESSPEVKAIFNLRTTLSQGSGIGAMTTIIDTLTQTGKHNENGSVTVDGELFQLLEENNEHTKSMLRGLSSAVTILENKISLQKISSNEILKNLPKIASELSEILEKNSITINMPLYKGSLITF